MDNLVHALSHEMQSKSTRTKLTGGQSFERAGLRLCAAIQQQNLQRRLSCAGSVQLAKLDFNVASELATVGVANYVCDRFVQRQGDRAAVLFPKPNGSRDRRNCCAYATQNLRIALKLEPQ